MYPTHGEVRSLMLMICLSDYKFNTKRHASSSETAPYTTYFLVLFFDYKLVNNALTSLIFANTALQKNSPL